MRLVLTSTGLSLNPENIAKLKTEDVKTFLKVSRFVNNPCVWIVQKTFSVHRQRCSKARVTSHFMH